VSASAPDLGTAAWSHRTGGYLTAADKWALARPLARTLLQLAAGRLGVAARPGGTRRRLDVDVTTLVPPNTILTRVAREHAADQLTPALRRHAERTYAFGAALGAIEGVDVDRELLYAASLLHDVGLAGRRTAGRAVDFTVTSADLAAQIAEDLGLSDAASETVRSAITLHHSPGVSLERHGPVADLLSAGAGVDVVGLRSWLLPKEVVRAVITAHPRDGFKAEFAAAWRAEGDRMPHGRARFLQRYGAFGLAIRLAPFAD
jgi:hypothetical protein